MPSCAFASMYHIQIQASSSDGELQDMLHEDKFAFVAECGFIKPAIKVTKEDIAAIIKAAFLAHIVFKTTQEISQFIEGLETLQIATLLRPHPKCLRKLFVKDPSEACVTSSVSVTLAVPISITTQTQSEREKEEAVLLAWSDYIQDMEGMHVNAREFRNFQKNVNDSPYVTSLIQSRKNLMLL